jgi:cyclophilin family peptidyl-prolyl cis-trans isomerase
MPKRLYVVVSCVVISWFVTATAQEPAAKAPAPGAAKAPQAAPPAGAAAAPANDFAALSTQFKELVARLSQMRRRYQVDPSVDKKAIEAEWKEKLAELESLKVKMASAGMKSYLAAPNTNDEVNEYLFAYLTSLVQTDDYEKAAKMVKLLADKGFKHKYFDLVSGLSYFGIADFDNAKKYLTLAKDANETDETGSRYLDLIDSHNYAELWQKEAALRAAEDKAGDLPKVKLSTSKGDIVVALLENEAPIATANFISLVEKGFYDGTQFHRVIPGFMAQGGDPKGDGSGGPGYTIPDECFESDHRNHFRGSLSMANTGERDTGGSQFFLNFLPTAHLDGKHTVFGRVIEGQDVLAKLQRRQPGDNLPADTITKATVVSKRAHAYDNYPKRPDKS